MTMILSDLSFFTFKICENLFNLYHLLSIFLLELHCFLTITEFVERISSSGNRQNSESPVNGGLFRCGWWRRRNLR